MKSPCFTCTRVQDPKSCENKTCKDWQAWFIDRWESMREFVRSEMENSPTQEVGVPLGGELYASPHRVREYLDENPCSHCPCFGNVCHTPCPVRVAWDEKRKDAIR